MAQPPDLEHKRKRDAEDYGQTASSQPIVPQQQQGQGQVNTGFINYLSRSTAENLTLLPSEPETFTDIIRTLSGYEGVLDRHESFAASLGAKLTGPRLLKGFEKFFEAPIKTNALNPFTQPITWLDVCTFAKANPNEFQLTTLPDGTRCCQFTCKGLQVEISEDDWRFINSGAWSRIPLEHPLEEDETAELATLDILEQRASALWRRADEVAARSRILHHKFGQRRQDILKRRKTQDESNPSGSRFQSVNQPGRRSSQGPTYDLHADLLSQFLSPPTPHSASRSTSNAGLSQGQSSPSIGTTSHQAHRLSGSGRSSNTANENPQSDTFRPLITQKIDKLVRNDPIAPPCDRCRRLKLQCVKHLTACQGCTKKHAKCSWKAVTDDEIRQLKREMGLENEVIDTEMEAAESRLMSVEGSRPASRTGTAEMPAYGQLLHSPGGRIELPPMRMSRPQGHGGGRAETPQSQGSVGPGQYAERPGGYGPSNPPSR